MVRRLPIHLAVLATLLCQTTQARAQMSPEEHAGHHPPTSEPSDAPPGPTSEPSAEGGMMAGGFQLPAPPLYPSLMVLPDLSPARIEEIRQDADERLLAGRQLMTSGLDDLVRSASLSDLVGMQRATAVIREGLARVETGLAAHRAIAGDEPPRDVALSWFREQMNLSTPAVATGWSGPFGLSWFHVAVMMLLVGLSAVMVAMYFYKMRRAEALLARLAAPPEGAGPLTEIAFVSTSGPDSTTAARSGRWRGSLRVARIFEETPTIKTFRLVDPDGGRVPFTFLAGQFVSLTIRGEGRPVRRAYTIASPPSRADYIDLTVKREAHGVVSGFLHDRVREGDHLEMTAPLGAFGFTGTESDSIVLIGGGVGITPLMSVLRHLTDRAWPGDIFLVYCARTPEDFLFREELSLLQRRHHNLHVVATMTGPAGSTWTGRTGRFTSELLAKSVPEIARRRAHLCGPASMMDAVRSMLAELGVPPEQIRSEVFGTAKRSPDARRLALTTGEPVGVEAPGGPTPTVTFALSKKSAPIRSGLTILDAGESIGVEIDNACRVGTCGTCRVRLLAGRVTMLSEDALDADDSAQGIILACQATCEADSTVEA